jgi:hypothetical protein
MSYTLAQQPTHTSLSPQMLVNLFMVTGMLAFVGALITQNMLVALGIAVLPVALIVVLYCIRSPYFAFAIYLFMSYYLAAFARYSYTEGWSVVLDVLLVFITIVTLIHAIIYKGSVRWLNGVNILTISYVIWMAFILIQLRYTSSEEYVMAIRSGLLATPIVYIMVSIFLNSQKVLKYSLIILGVFTITAFIKVLIQKYYWFDAAETNWLMQGHWRTHMIQSGIRYFSFFSDAGNFGIHMGMVTIVYFIISFLTPEKWLRWFYLFISGIAALCLLFSGTRSSVAVPMAGFALFMVLSLKPKIIISTTILGVFFYLFFAYTTIGDGSPMIRRMRTAFTPTEDASFNVRKENQKLVVEYLKTHPWGAGLRGAIPITRENETEEYVDDVLPPDSYFVSIWMQTGYVGLFIHIAIYILVMMWCCFTVMFRIRNGRLRLTMAALLSGVFGMLVNGYAGEAMGMPPNNFLIPAMLAFVLNGPYMEKTELDSTPMNINV